MVKKVKSGWKKVKIAGNVISDEGADLDGLIGLEILKEYDINMIKSLNKPKNENPVEINTKKFKKTSKQTSDSDSDNEVKKKKLKKIKMKKKLKINKEKVLNSVKDEEHYPGKFVLLKPQKKENMSKSEISDTIDNPKDIESLLSELQGWNGMGIHESILKGIAEKGFKSPTEIQSLTIPPAILGKRDILGAAETGSGKTLAFGIPVLNGIIYLKERMQNGKSIIFRNINKNTVPEIEEQEEVDEIDLDVPDIETDDDDIDEDNNDKYNRENKNCPLYALILTPTRELAVQIRDHIKAIAVHTGIKIAAVFGGLAAVKQERLLSKCPEIVVATPGRFWELLQEGNPHLNKVDNINFLIIDETDRMIEKGHFEELRLLIQRLNIHNIKTLQRQNFVFSATLTFVHDLPEYLQKVNKKKNYRFLKETPGQKIQSLIELLGISQPKIVDITQTTGTAQTLTECRISCELDEKDFYLYYFLLKHPGRTIVFCNSIDCVRRLAQLFSILDCKPLPLHANMAQRQRLKNLERFRDNPNGVLVATDVAARGLDIPKVQHVIHYQVPRTSENYVHRSGRTARANNEGIAILLMEPTEVKNYIKLCSTLGRSEDLPLFPVSSHDLKAIRERVLVAREIDSFDLKTRRVLADMGWKNKVAEEADMIVDDSENSSNVDSDDEETELNKSKRFLRQKKAQLEKLLAKQIFPEGLSFKYPTYNSNQNPATAVNENNNKNAVTVMKNAIKEYEKDKKRHKNYDQILSKRKFQKL